jgi:hypothetical protein
MENSLNNFIIHIFRSTLPLFFLRCGGEVREESFVECDDDVMEF